MGLPQPPLETTLPQPAAPPLAPPLSGIKRGNRFLAIALLATLILWNLRYGWIALYPFKIFATWLHETSHGFFMLITRAGLEHLDIFRDTSGLAYPKYGVGPLARGIISSAGYMGTAFAGALFLVLGRTPRGARVVFHILGGLMLLTVALFIRNDFGMVAIGIGGLALILLGYFGTETICGFFLNFLAAQSCINAVLDIRVLFSARMYVNGTEIPQGSDAHAVSAAWGGSPSLWASMWLIWSFILFFVALRYTRLRGGKEPTSTIPVRA